MRSSGSVSPEAKRKLWMRYSPGVPEGPEYAGCCALAAATINHIAMIATIATSTMRNGEPGRLNFFPANIPHLARRKMYYTPHRPGWAARLAIGDDILSRTQRSRLGAEN